MRPNYQTDKIKVIQKRMIYPLDPFGLSLSLGVWAACFWCAYNAQIVHVLNLMLLLWGWMISFIFHNCTIGIWLLWGCWLGCFFLQFSKLFLGFGLPLFPSRNMWKGLLQVIFGFWPSFVSIQVIFGFRPSFVSFQVIFGFLPSFVSFQIIFGFRPSFVS